jgi:hypothetical protein
MYCICCSEIRLIKDKLITALRTAVDNDGTPDKEATSYNDMFDAFRLAKFYHYEDSNSEYDCIRCTLLQNRRILRYGFRFLNVSL